MVICFDRIASKLLLSTLACAASVQGSEPAPPPPAEIESSEFGFAVVPPSPPSRIDFDGEDGSAVPNASGYSNAGGEGLNGSRYVSPPADPEAPYESGKSNAGGGELDWSAYSQDPPANAVPGSSSGYSNFESGLGEGALAPPPLPPSVRIRSPKWNGASLRYLLNEHSYSIRPGEAQQVPTDRAWTIRFHDGRNGTKVYRLRPGNYEFGVENGVWELYSAD